MHSEVFQSNWSLEIWVEKDIWLRHDVKEGICFQNGLSDCSSLKDWYLCYSTNDRRISKYLVGFSEYTKREGLMISGDNFAGIR